MKVAARLDEGFGTSITWSPHGSLWVASTTNVARLWRGDDLLHSVDVNGHIGGRAGFSDDGSAVRVGRYAIDVASGDVSVVGNHTESRWLAAALEIPPDVGVDEPDADDSMLVVAAAAKEAGLPANPSDFTAPVVVHIPNSQVAVVRTQYQESRDRGSASSYAGPTAQLMLVDLESDSLVAALAYDGSEFRCIDASADVIVAASLRRVHTFNSGTGEPIASWKADDIVDAVALSPTDEVATLNRDGWVFVSAADGDDLTGWHVHDDGGAALAWSPSGDRLAVGSRAGHVTVWDVSSGDPQLVSTYHADSVGGLAFAGSDDGLIVATDVVDQSMLRVVF